MVWLEGTLEITYFQSCCHGGVAANLDQCDISPKSCVEEA